METRVPPSIVHDISILVHQHENKNQKIKTPGLLYKWSCHGLDGTFAHKLLWFPRVGGTVWGGCGNTGAVT